MAASYPAGFDTMSDPSTNLSGPPLHSTMHNQINDVIEAIEAELGINPSGADATVAATLSALPSRYVSLTGGVLLTDTAQTITTAVGTDITWSTEVSDPDGWTAGAIALLTVPAGKGGRYVVTYSGSWSAAPGTTPAINCVINGTISYEVAGIPVFAGFIQNLTFIKTLVAGDTLKFQAFHNAGANRDLLSRLEIAPV